MVFTILVYSIFTGISGLASNIWEFILYRFLCGLGVGGQFAVGVVLVAEYMPGHVRPRALAFLQAMANLGKRDRRFSQHRFRAVGTIELDHTRVGPGE